MPYRILSDHIPLTLGGGLLEFTFKLAPPVLGRGIVFYMLDGQGGRGYRIDLNGQQGPLFSTPPIRLYGSFCTVLGELKSGVTNADTNVLQFISVGTGPPLNLLHIVLSFNNSEEGLVGVL